MFRKISLSIENEARAVVAIGETSKTVCETVSHFAKWQKQPARRFRHSRNDKNSLREGFAIGDKFSRDVLSKINM